MERSDKKIHHVALATEKLGSVFDSFRIWLTQSWKIALLLSKGAYLLTERKALYNKLGEDVYYKIRKGEWQNSELEPLIAKIDRLNKKIELEELQIRNVRYGKKGPLDDEDLDAPL